MRSMILAGEDLPAIHRVTEAHLQAVFDEAEADFGKFIVLAESDSRFIQSACVWEPTPECERFLKQMDSLPFCLEYKDESTGEMYAAEGWFTLREVKDTFMDYYRGKTSWKDEKVWKKLQY